ncbi:glycosyltransferase [Flavobacterium sp. RHBU_3]|uniref:glycosyltransferase n=1 Tax=Flavobacterium sp. RHBU_3 TaxID=3391184 RepID=UPI00398461AB
MKSSITSANLTIDNSFIPRETDTIENIDLETAEKDKSFNLRGTLLLTVTLLLLLVGSFLVYLLQPEFDALYQERINTFWGRSIIVTSIALLGIKGLFFLYNLYLYSKYKPIKSVTDEQLPVITVIVPAYNEGQLVWHTLQSLAASDYPTHKLQLIAIDDGSKDDTWQWIQQAKHDLGARVTIYKQPKNMGKRHALYYGFNNGIGEVFVTVDSDSVVKPNTLRNLVSPLVVKKDCGAVAGNVRVLNNRSAILPKMLNVSFVLSFEFIRSAESALGSVMCTPGALAAYRREAVMACLPEWIDQKFMGKKSDIGEDRAMTNMIMKQGFHVLFQRNAYVLTNVPEKYKGLYKMFIRWGRSNIRENIKMATFVFKNYRKENKAGIRLLFANQLLTTVAAYPFLILMFYFIVSHPALFLSSTLMGILLYSSFPVFFYTKRYNKFSESLYAYAYSLLYTFSLFWITPYAIATAGKSGWLTRG